MRRRRSVAMMLATCTALVSAVTVTQAGTASAAVPGTLYAGHQLVARTGHDRIDSATAEYDLVVSPDEVEIDQNAPLNGSRGPDTTGTGLWFRDDPEGHYQSNTDHSTLTMQTNGNLVLRTGKGHVLWSSRTSGTGTHNRVVMQGDGNLVMYTSTNRAVWATRTTAALLPAGRTLASGRHLSDVWNDQLGAPIPSLVMQRNGDLQYRCRARVLWHTHTSVPGSYAVMRTDGNFVVYSPARKPLWSTHTAGRGSYTWLSVPQMLLYDFHFTRLWQARITADC